MMIFIPSFAWLFWTFNCTVDLVWPFLGFRLKSWLCMTFLGFRLKCFPRKTDLNQLKTQAVSRRPESIQLLMTQAAFQELTQNQLMTQVDSQVFIHIDSRLKMLPDFSIQINSWQAKKHLIVSRLLIRLWVMPMSANKKRWIRIANHKDIWINKHHSNDNDSIIKMTERFTRNIILLKKTQTKNEVRLRKLMMFCKSLGHFYIRSRLVNVTNSLCSQSLKKAVSAAISQRNSIVSPYGS